MERMMNMDRQQALNILYKIARMSGMDRLLHMTGEDHDRIRQAGQVLQEFITESAKLGSQAPSEDKADDET